MLPHNGAGMRSDDDESHLKPTRTQINGGLGGVVLPQVATQAENLASLDTPLSPRRPSCDDLTTRRRSTRSSIKRMSANMDDSLFLTLAEIGGGKASKLNKEAVQRDAGILNKRLKRINRMLLDPNSKKMQYWDFVTIFALFFTAILTPYEVCMLWAPTEVDALFIVNYFVNSIFMFDTLSNFFLPFRETRRRGGGIVKSHRKIALRYLKGW
eukprot:4505110-Prymnesium_polylepis.1